MKTQSLTPRFGDLVASFWKDWSGFFAWIFKIGILMLVLYGSSRAADWTTERTFGGRSSAFALLGTQALDAVFNGFAFAICVTILLVRRFVRSRIAHLFALMWLGFTLWFFAILFSLPLPLWQALAVKVLLCIVGFGIAGLILKRWWGHFWIAADSEEESHA